MLSYRSSCKNAPFHNHRVNDLTKEIKCMMCGEDIDLTGAVEEKSHSAHTDDYLKHYYFTLGVGGYLNAIS